MPVTTGRQLRLPFPFQPGFAAVDFMTGDSNEAALAWLNRTQDWPDRRLALWGPSGCGKTHLLHIWADRMGAETWHGPELRGVPLPPASGGIAIDDADALADEPALLHLLNASLAAGLPVLLAATRAPARWTTRLPDLTSRLRAITAIEVHTPEDSLLQALLARLLADRQLAVAPALQDWLLLRLARTPAALREAVLRLDRAELRQRGRITKALAASVLAAMDEDSMSYDGSDNEPSSRGGARPVETG